MPKKSSDQFTVHAEANELRQRQRDMNREAHAAARNDRLAWEDQVRDLELAAIARSGRELTAAEQDECLSAVARTEDVPVAMTPEQAMQRILSSGRPLSAAEIERFAKLTR